ncbi:hypothetical protein K3495_g95 [Podosphaera aphanis]|nr:hypothetical protein K3495_g95 [Podosphaera aphanis]
MGARARASKQASKAEHCTEEPQPPSATSVRDPETRQQRTRIDSISLLKHRFTQKFRTWSQPASQDFVKMAGHRIVAYP